MHRAAVHSGKNPPGRIVNIGGLAGRWQPMRIRHRRKVTVIGVADPTRTRQIGAILPGAAAAEHWLVRCRDDVLIEAFAPERKALPIEFRIARGAGTETVGCECRL